MGKLFKYLIVLTLLLVILNIAIQEKDNILIVYRNIVYNESNYVIKESNEYTRNYDFDYVQRTTSLIAKNKQDILNIYYSELNAGNTKFEFLCDNSYKECLYDVELLANTESNLNYLNNFVHPFNTFKSIETSHNNIGVVDVEYVKSYTDEQIKEINTKIDQLYPIFAQQLNGTNQIQVIKLIHDYIINTTIYDSNRADNNIIQYQSDIAYGPLFEGYALCGGYTDLMELFLERLNIKSYQVTASKHIWNGIEINGIWYNLDLTWDDPVTNTGSQILLNDYFLIDSNKMRQLDLTEHDFDKTIYTEMN